MGAMRVGVMPVGGLLLWRPSNVSSSRATAAAATGCRYADPREAEHAAKVAAGAAAREAHANAMRTYEEQILAKQVLETLFTKRPTHKGACAVKPWVLGKRPWPSVLTQGCLRRQTVTSSTRNPQPPTTPVAHAPPPPQSEILSVARAAAARRAGLLLAGPEGHMAALADFPAGNALLEGFLDASGPAVRPRFGLLLCRVA